MYMALHIADPEVSKLADQLAALDKTTKTEALRRLLKREIEERRVREKRKKFTAIAREVIQEARAQKIKPVTKEEMDQLWGQ
jgi:antitoxin VapB